VPARRPLNVGQWELTGAPGEATAEMF